MVDRDGGVSIARVGLAKASGRLLLMAVSAAALVGGTLSIGAFVLGDTLIRAMVGEDHADAGHLLGPYALATTLFVVANLLAVSDLAAGRRPPAGAGRRGSDRPDGAARADGSPGYHLDRLRPVRCDGGARGRARLSTGDAPSLVRDELSSDTSLRDLAHRQRRPARLR
jgi:hypothetical protein